MLTLQNFLDQRRTHEEFERLQLLFFVEASIREMVAPACLVILSPLAAGTFFGIQAVLLLVVKMLIVAMPGALVASLLLVVRPP